MKCLLVDDSKTMRIIQRSALASIPGIEFAEAGDGVEALAAMARTPGGFTFAIVDWNMPNLDGISLIKKVRETDRRTLLIMVTTEAEKPRVLDAIRAGVNNYLIKPFDATELLQKVQQTLEKAKAAAA